MRRQIDMAREELKPLPAKELRRLRDELRKIPVKTPDEVAKEIAISELLH